MALLWAGGGLCQEVLVLALLRTSTCETADADPDDSPDADPDDGETERG